MPSPNNVRFAVPEDEDALVDLLDCLESDNGFGIVKDPAKVLQQIQIGTRQGGGIIGVIDGPDMLVASVGLFMSQWWYSTEVYLGELWLFVHPDYRYNGFDKDLFEFALGIKNKFSEAMGKSVALVSSVSSPSRLAAKTRLWKTRLGPDAKLVGNIFVVE